MRADHLQLAKALMAAALYLKQQTLAHRSALVVEEMYAKSGDDPNVRQSANSAVPVIRSHGDMANRTAAQFGGQ